MRSIPTAITDGFTNGYRPFWLIKVEGSGGNTFYWPTTKKNKAGNSMTLKETSGGSALTYDETMIAVEVEEGARGGIGPMTKTVDLYAGGGVGSIGDVRIDILNQEAFHEDIAFTGINLENRPVTVYFGFIPSGVTPTVIITDDMIALWSGVIDDVGNYTHGDYSLHCIDSSLQRHKKIPTTVINKNDFPNAPKENLGKPIPMLYGNFEEADIDLARDFELLSPAPGVKTDDLTNEFRFADHELHTFGDLYCWSEGLQAFGKLLTAPTKSNTSAGAIADWTNTLVGDTIVASIILQPKSVQESVGAANGINAVDDDVTSVASILLSALPQRTFETQLPRPNDDGALTASGGSGSPEIKMHTRFGAIASATNARAQYSDTSGVSWTDFGAFTTGDANTRKTFTFTYANLTWDILGGMYFRLGVSAGTDLSCDVKNMAIELHVKVAQIMYRSQNQIRGSK